MGGFRKVRIGHAGAAQNRAFKRDGCSANFYTAPAAGTTVSSGTPLTISWSNTGLSPAPQYVDVYLYAPSRNASLIQAFDAADYKHGSMETTLDPSWWDNASSVDLQVSILPHGQLSFLTNCPAGPVFTATYNSSDPSVPAPQPTDGGNPSIAQHVKNILKQMSGGAIAAAVIIPLLVVGGLIAWAYIRYARKRASKETARFSQHVDKRMSTISTDWRSMSGAGANAAVRNSVAVRDSNSLYGVAGIGSIRTSEEPIPQMEQMRQARSSVFTNNPEARVSRISFAPDTRSSYLEKEAPRLPSAVRGLNTRSFHRGTSYEDERVEDAHRAELNMSPTQSQGPTLLHPADIAARVSSDDEFRREVLQMPAMTLMRTGEHNIGENKYSGNDDSDLVLSSRSEAKEIALPSPAALMPPSGHTTPSLSPDAMLRAYAAGRAPTPGVNSATNTSSGMRILYAPEASPSLASSTTLAGPASTENNPFRKSMAQQSMYTESMYSGVYEDEQWQREQHQQQHQQQYYGDNHGYGHAQ